MTREEAISLIKSAQLMLINPTTNEPVSDLYESLEMAIKALEKENIYDDKEHYVTISKALYDKLNIDYEQALSQEQKSGKWIPVSEPPKELGTYLIQTDGEPYMRQCRWTDVNPFWTDIKTKPHWNIFDLPQYSKVVAWMPLPKPYEPRESKKVNCKSTKCDNCINHNYCDFEPQESEDKE